MASVSPNANDSKNVSFVWWPNKVTSVHSNGFVRIVQKLSDRNKNALTAFPSRMAMYPDSNGCTSVESARHPTRYREETEHNSIGYKVVAFGKTYLLANVSTMMMIGTVDFGSMQCYFEPWLSSNREVINDRSDRKRKFYRLRIQSLHFSDVSAIHEFSQ
jgi:hypothetical protein